MIGVTFTIKYDESYSDRYRALQQALSRFNPIEDGTTSCVFLDTQSTVDAVNTALYGALDYLKDRAIVFETYRHTFKPFGLS